MPNHYSNGQGGQGGNGHHGGQGGNGHHGGQGGNGHHGGQGGNHHASCDYHLAFAGDSLDHLWNGFFSDHGHA